MNHRSQLRSTWWASRNAALKSRCSSYVESYRQNTCPSFGRPYTTATASPSPVGVPHQMLPTFLTHRGVISIAGADTFKLLQGLITNDMSLLNPTHALATPPTKHARTSTRNQLPSIYSFFLNKDGRVLFDVFINRVGDTDE